VQDSVRSRLSELIEDTDVWVQMQDADGRYWVQDVQERVIVDNASRENSELIVRLRNHFANLGGFIS